MRLVPKIALRLNDHVHWTAKTAAVAGIALCAGLVGYFIGTRELSTSRYSQAGAAHNEPSSRREVSARQPTLSSTTGAAVIAPHDARADAGITQRLQLLADLQKQKVIGVGMNVINRDGDIADSFITLFGLSESERNALQQTLRETRQQIDQLILSNATPRQEGDAFVIKVKPFDGGADLEDHLMNSFRSVLGEERYNAFVSLTGGGLYNYFDEFGAQERTVTFWRAATDGEAAKVFARDERKSPKANGATAGPRDLDALPGQYQWMRTFAPYIVNLPPRPSPGSP